MDKTKPVSESLIGPRLFWLLVVIGIMLVTIGGVVAWIGPKVSKAPQAVDENCHVLPKNFKKEISLPRRADCWKLYLSPEFSGKIRIPDQVNFTLDWEKDAPAEIKFGSGKVIYLSHPQSRYRDLGIDARNRVLRFRGQGWVKISIEPRN